MSKLNEIEAFLAVSRNGSFVAAADELGLSSSYVSKLVARLESKLGARLFQRTTRSLVMTPVGERYFADCEAAFALLERAEEQVQDASVLLRGEVRLTAPTGLGLQVLAGLLNRFALLHPEVRLSTAYLDRMVDLIEERFDLALRVGPLPDSSLRVRKIATYTRRVVANPALVDSLGAMSHPDALAGLPAVTYLGNEQPNAWTLTDGEDSTTVSVVPRLSSNSGRAVALAAADGIGVACLPTFHTKDLEQQGRLVRIVPEWFISAPLHIVFPTNQHLSSRVRALIDFMATEFALVAD